MTKMGAKFLKLAAKNSMVGETPRIFIFLSPFSRLSQYIDITAASLAMWENGVLLEHLSTNFIAEGQMRKSQRRTVKGMTWMEKSLHNWMVLACQWGRAVQPRSKKNINWGYSCEKLRCIARNCRTRIIYHCRIYREQERSHKRRSATVWKFHMADSEAYLQRNCMTSDHVNSFMIINCSASNHTVTTQPTSIPWEKWIE